MKELRVTLRVRNNRLMKRRETEGKSAREMADAIGVSYGLYLKLESLKDSPYGRTGELRPAARVISEYFGVVPEELWPAGVLAVKQNQVQKEIDADDVGHLLGQSREPLMLPDHCAEQKERLEMVRDAMGILCARHRQVIEQRMAGESLEDVGRDLGVTKERVRQMQATAFFRIRKNLAEKLGCEYAWEIDDAI